MKRIKGVIRRRSTSRGARPEPTAAPARALPFGDDVVSTLKGGGDGGSHRRLHARGLLVSGQFAISLVLLTGALLLVRTLRSAYSIDPGFRTTGILLAPVTPLPGFEGDVDPANVALQLQERIRAIPGVDAVSWGSAMPLAGRGSRTSFRIDGYTPAAGEDMEFHFNSVGPGWFETTGVAIVRGRAIDGTDRQGAAGAVVVNETFARRFWPGDDAIGHRLSNGRLDLTVVGVARDVSWLSLTEPARPYVWLSGQQLLRGLVFTIRTDAPTGGVTPAIAEVVESVAAGWRVIGARSLEDQLASSLFSQRLAAMVIGAFGLLALLLAAAGLYGVVAFAVAQRTREVGVRLALGARPSAVRGLFVRQSLPFLAIGAVVGLAGAFAATRVLGGMLIGVSATDPVAFLVAPVLLGGAAMLASWVPARRAAKVDPILALRAE
jgi:predicted permease